MAGRIAMRYGLPLLLTTLPFDSSPKDFRVGASHYATCAACHGQRAEGNEALASPRLTGLEGWYLVRQLKNFKAGIRGEHPDDIFGAQMRPMVALLPDQQAIEDVVAYIGTLGSEPAPNANAHASHAADRMAERHEDLTIGANQSELKAGADVTSAQLECAAVMSDKRLEAARTLSVRTYSSDDLVCASRLYHAMAKAHTDDIALQIEAMTAMNNTLHYLQVLVSQDLMGVNRLNVAHATAVGDMLLDLAADAYTTAPDSPGVMVNKALAAKITDGAYDADLLVKAIDTAPSTLNGLAQIRLGRMLFELPTILGGDVEQSIDLLNQALEVDPGSIQALYYLAESYDQELEEGKAAAVMGNMLAVTPEPAEMQMAVDMLRLASGLAKRIRQQDLSVELRTRRNNLLEDNPELLTRVSIAVGGHGGEHPLGNEP